MLSKFWRFRKIISVFLIGDFIFILSTKKSCVLYTYFSELGHVSHTYLGELGCVLRIQGAWSCQTWLPLLQHILNQQPLSSSTTIVHLQKASKHGQLASFQLISSSKIIHLAPNKPQLGCFSSTPAMVTNNGTTWSCYLQWWELG